MQLPDLSLLAVMVLFWATFFVLKTFLFRPLGDILRERDEAAARATQALETALAREREALQTIDQKMTEARRAALALHESVRAEAATARQSALDAARDGARRTVAAGDEKLSAEVAAARRDLEGAAKSTAQEIAGLALGRKVA
ncbi:MAG TPA: hypothetical protein VGR00_10175 [Thermoanaerobaculia bacterium]|jgi:F-type H+-transporting ATPase subunit b|nr:hypothetical protein [Thermoanaerobaculia bacterium]